MKRFFVVVLTLLAVGQFSLAQDASRMLTMEQAVLGTGLRTPVPMTRWTSDKQVIALVESPRGMMPPMGRGPRQQFAYTRGNNLYYKDKAGVEHAITAYDDPGIVCGTSVSRNEFGINGGIFVSPDSSKIAFYRKDERAVTLFPLL